MGISTDAHLFYGVEITDGDGDWLTNEPTGDWWVNRNETGMDDDDIDMDVVDAFDKIKIRDVPELAGIGIDWHCHISYSTHVLHICGITAWRGSPQYLNLESLEKQRVEEDWDGRLATALKWLGIEPKVKPGWILASSSDH